MIVFNSIKLTTSTVLEMKEESRQWYPYETGGILIGNYENETVNIMHAIGPGPNAKHGLSQFVRDGDYAQCKLDLHYQISYGQYDYVGEWHSHPKPIGASWCDRKSLVWISHNPAYDMTSPILVICVYNSNKQWTFRGYQWQGSIMADLKVIEGIR